MILRELAEKLKVKGSNKLEKQPLILKTLYAQVLNPATDDTELARMAAISNIKSKLNRECIN